MKKEIKQLTPFDNEWYDALIMEYDEKWKDIPNYEGYYMVSNYGRVASLLFQNNVYNKKYKRFKILKPKGLKGKNIYKTGFRVDLWKDGEVKSYLVARLVAFTFYNKNICNHKLTVDHIDGNRLNNHIDNLELVSLRENIKRAYKTGLHNSHIHKVKIINKINNKTKYFNSLSEASKYIGNSKGYISDCLKKRKFENEKYKWKVI